MDARATTELPNSSCLSTSIFQEPWWLSTVTGGRCEEVVVVRGGNVVGRLSYYPGRIGPFRVARMPPFTHLLGPVVHTGVGKPQTRLSHRLSITRELIDQLPRFSLFEQHFDPSPDSGLAVADGLAFQDRGFSVAAQYTFDVDCRQSVESLWDAMHFKTRQHVRRAEEKFTVRSVDDPDFFSSVYIKNTAARWKVNRMDFDRFPAIFAECRSRRCGEIIGAFAADGSPVAMTFLVWDAKAMYYLMSTRSEAPNDNGSVNLLIWSAMKRAHALGLTFDLDGVATSGSARFLSGFGGRIQTRFLVRRGEPLFSSLQYVKLRYTKNQTRFFT
jgi:hypothetical protein